MSSTNSNRDSLIRFGTEINCFSGTDIVPVISIPLMSYDGQVIKTIPVSLGMIQTISISTHRDKYPIRALGNVNPMGFSGSGRMISGTLVFLNFDRQALGLAIEQLKDYIRINHDTIDKTTLKRLRSDNIPPFDILILAANEYGRTANMILHGVTILDEGMIITIDNLQINTQMSFMALDYEPLAPGSIEMRTLQNNETPNEQTHDVQLHNLDYQDINNDQDWIQYYQQTNGLVFTDETQPY
jgi:hypothetical protein